MPKPLASKNKSGVQPRSLGGGAERASQVPAKFQPDYGSFQAGRNAPREFAPRPETTEMKSWRREPSSPAPPKSPSPKGNEDDYLQEDEEEQESDAQEFLSETTNNGGGQSKKRTPSNGKSANCASSVTGESEETIRFLAAALMQMKEALSKMQDHLSDQNKKWSETEQKLKYEMGEIAKVRENFGAQMSSLKTDLRTLKEDLGGVAVTEKFEAFENQIADIRDRTNQFLGTLVRDVWAYVNPPLDLFSVDNGNNQPVDTQFLEAGTQIVLMPPSHKTEDTGLWIRARLISRKVGDQQIFWVPLETVPQALPPSGIFPEDAPAIEATGMVECFADYHLFGSGSHSSSSYQPSHETTSFDRRDHLSDDSDEGAVEVHLP